MTCGPGTAHRKAGRGENGAGSTPGAGRAGSGSFRGGAIRDDDGAGSTSGVARDGPGGSLGGAVSDSASHGGVTDTMSDPYLDVDFEGDSGSEIPTVFHYAAADHSM